MTETGKIELHLKDGRVISIDVNSSEGFFDVLAQSQVEKIVTMRYTRVAVMTRTEQVVG